MSYNNYPKTEWNNSNELLKTSKSTNNETLINEILKFSKNTEIWNNIGASFEYWETKGFNDITIPSINFKKMEFKGELLLNLKGKVIGINLNKNLIKSFEVPYFSQILIMELGNLKTKSSYNQLFANAKDYTKEDFVKKVEKFEYNIRNEIINAFLQGEFNSEKYKNQPCIFEAKKITFEEYYNDERLKNHKKGYEDLWEELTTD
ncbi:hypothetical protein [Olleya sp. R77988]|uniref:hypothetical protein n=1 Tax=Olleya sp. R77988 TaxID=3093875 RepID=UPI0037C74029